MVKVYHVLLDKVIRPIHLHKLRRGIDLDGTNTLPCKINELRIVDNQSFLEMELKEGRNRQIRRMFEYFDYEVVQLERISFAGITKGKLKRGEWRYLKTHEVTELKERVA